MNVSMITDVIVVLIIVVFGIAGWRKGIIGSLVGMLSLAASLILAWMLYPFASDFLTMVGVRERIYLGVLEKTSVKGGGTEALLLPEAFKDVAERTVNSAAEVTATYISDIVLNISSFVLVVLVSIIVIKIAARLLGVISKLPVLNGLNRLGGLMFGLAEGVLIVCIAMTLYAGTLPENGEELGNGVENSIIFKKMYNKNPITNIFIEKETERLDCE